MKLSNINEIERYIDDNNFIRVIVKKTENGTPYLDGQPVVGSVNPGNGTGLLAFAYRDKRTGKMSCDIYPLLVWEDVTDKNTRSIAFRKTVVENGISETHIFYEA